MRLLFNRLPKSAFQHFPSKSHYPRTASSGCFRLLAPGDPAFGCFPNICSSAFPSPDPVRLFPARHASSNHVPTTAFGSFRLPEVSGSAPLGFFRPSLGLILSIRLFPLPFGRAVGLGKKKSLLPVTRPPPPSSPSHLALPPFSISRLLRATPPFCVNF